MEVKSILSYRAMYQRKALIQSPDACQELNPYQSTIIVEATAQMILHFGKLKKTTMPSAMMTHACPKQILKITAWHTILLRNAFLCNSQNT